MSDIERLRSVLDDIARLKEVACSSATTMEYLSACSPVEHRCYSFLYERGSALLSDYERLRGMEERVKGAAVGACAFFKEGALIHAATVYFDLNNPVDAQKISGQTVALVPVPGGE
jgi:hypothetical protein